MIIRRGSGLIAALALLAVSGCSASSTPTDSSTSAFPSTSTSSSVSYTYPEAVVANFVGACVGDAKGQARSAALARCSCIIRGAQKTIPFDSFAANEAAVGRGGKPSAAISELANECSTKPTSY